MLDGVMLLWFILTAISVVFVAIDIRTIRTTQIFDSHAIITGQYACMTARDAHILTTPL